MKFTISLLVAVLATGAFAAATPVQDGPKLVARQNCEDRKEDWEECLEDLEDELEDWQECLEEAEEERIRFQNCVPPTGAAGAALDAFYACMAEEDRLEDIYDACDDNPTTTVAQCAPLRNNVRAQEAECDRLDAAFKVFGQEDCFMRERHWREEVEECRELEADYRSDKATCARLESRLC